MSWPDRGRRGSWREGLASWGGGGGVQSRAVRGAVEESPGSWGESDVSMS